MIEITPTIAIDPREIAERFIRSPGPGGQKIRVYHYQGVTLAKLLEVAEPEQENIPF